MNALRQLSIGLLTVVASNLVQAAVIPCTADQTKVAGSAAIAAKDMLASTIAAIKAGDADVAAKMGTWLGVVNSSQAGQVQSRLEAISLALSKLTFQCDNMTHADPKKNIFASVNPAGGYFINLGAKYFQAKEKGFDSRPGVLIHEVSHFILTGGGVGDKNAAGKKVYGTAAVLALAKTSPAEAQNVADAYEYLVEAHAFKLRPPK